MSNKLKLASTVFGVGFLAAGIASYLPLFTPGGNLLGLFAVDGIHSIVYIITGLLGLYTAYHLTHAKLYFRIFGVIFAALALAGFLHAGGTFIAHANSADNLVFLIVGLIALYLGFLTGKKE